MSDYSKTFDTVEDREYLRQYAEFRRTKYIYPVAPNPYALQRQKNRLDEMLKLLDEDTSPRVVITASPEFS